MSKSVEQEAEKKFQEVVEAVWAEYAVACYANRPFNSAHEGWAVLREEVDELWDEVKKNRKRRQRCVMTEEAIQVAAMAIRFLVDVCRYGEPETDK